MSCADGPEKSKILPWTEEACITEECLQRKEEASERPFSTITDGTNKSPKVILHGIRIYTRIGLSGPLKDTKQNPLGRGQNLQQKGCTASRRSSQPLFPPHPMGTRECKSNTLPRNCSSEEKVNRFQIRNAYQGKFTCTISEQRKVLDNLRMSKMKRNDMAKINTPQTHDEKKDHNIRNNINQRKEESFPASCWYLRRT